MTEAGDTAAPGEDGGWLGPVGPGSRRRWLQPIADRCLAVAASPAPSRPEVLALLAELATEAAAYAGPMDREHGDDLSRLATRLRALAAAG